MENNEIKNLYLLSGDEEYEKDRYLIKFRKNFNNLVRGINYIFIDEDNINILEDELNTFCFGSDKKLIIVKDAEILPDNIYSRLESPLDGICLVLILSGKPKVKLQKIVQKYGEIISFDKEKPAALRDWAIDICAKYKVSLSKENAEYFINSCGDDKRYLINELRKIIEFTGSGNEILKSSIDKLCIKTSEVIIFDLTDSIGKRNISKALSNFRELIDNKEPIQKIIIMLAKHFKSLLLAKIAVESGKNVQQELELKSPYPAMKYKDQAKNFTIKELTRITKELINLDADSKVGKIDLEIGIEKIICSC